MQNDNRAPATNPGSPAPSRPRPDRFARFARQLKVMKVEGRSTDDMLIRLRVQGLVVDETELADFWARQAAAAQAKAQARAKARANKGRAELPLTGVQLYLIELKGLLDIVVSGWRRDFARLDCKYLPGSSLLKYADT